jgi:hypothetical protein
MTVKTVLNNLWTHIGYEDDGHLVHTDKRTGAQKISLKAWFDVASARRALDAGIEKIEWKELKGRRPPPRMMCHSAFAVADAPHLPTNSTY